MPYCEIPGTSSRYALLAFDQKGCEVREGPGGVNGLMSEELLQSVQKDPPQDIFLFSHGWLNDVPAATERYNRWIKALVERTPESERGRSLYIGLHWPSLPWGDEELGADGSFAAGDGISLDDLKQLYIERFGDEEPIRSALGVIFHEARVNAGATTLEESVAAAYLQLNAALGGLEAGGVAAAPGDDCERFDPELSFQLASVSSSGYGFGAFNVGGPFLEILRWLSFWTMKKRARTIGESGMHDFIARMQSACPARIHLIGHSFGCIVVSSMIGGPGGNSSLLRAVESAVLVQGAVSLWAYASAIPPAAGHPPGYYYHRVIEGGAVNGPVVTTRSEHDRIVRYAYPAASFVTGDVAFDATNNELPPYGGIGMFGICGVAKAENRQMLDQNGRYGFKPGGVYNLDGSQYIRAGGGISGAHSDICGPEVANAILQAAGLGAQATTEGAGT